MRYGLSVVVPPAKEPLSLAEAKQHLRLELDCPDEDGLVADLVKAGRERCEKVSGRALVTQTLLATWDQLPYWPAITYEAWNELAVLRLPRPPLQSIVSVVFVDTAGVSQTLAATEYQVEAQQEPGRIRPAYGKIWPVTRAQLGAVAVTYVAGYGDVPAEIRTRIKVYVGYCYERRDEVLDEDFLDRLFAGFGYGGYS